jgi:HlyD family secretion protein
MWHVLSARWIPLAAAGDYKDVRSPFRLLVGSMLLLLAVLAAGCQHASPETATSVSSEPVVRIVKPQRRNLSAAIDQPGFVQAFEETAIYSKVSGFIKQYFVDIGRRVKKGDPIVEIFVPELDEDHQEKAAEVVLDRQLVKQAESKVQTAIARIAEAKANVNRYLADIVRWESEVQRISQMVTEHVMDRQVLDETQKQLSSSNAMREAAVAAVDARDADLAQAKIDVETARAQVRVAEANERRTAAMLAYTKIIAPYDGVITVRNANTNDYVQAAAGDKTTTQGAPMFKIAADDKVRIFVDVPEAYARYVRDGTKATVRVDALSGFEHEATVTRTSWSVMERTRTLRAEIDLPTHDSELPAGNAEFALTTVDPPGKANDPPAKIIDRQTQYIDGLRPGMYVNVTVTVERTNVWALPRAALVVTGNQTFCYLLRGGKAVKTAVAPGLNDGSFAEVTKINVDGQWEKVSGDEEVILGSLDELTDGQAVKVERAAAAGGS